MIWASCPFNHLLCALLVSLFERPSAEGWPKPGRDYLPLARPTSGLPSESQKGKGFCQGTGFLKAKRFACCHHSCIEGVVLRGVMRCLCWMPLPPAASANCISLDRPRQANRQVVQLFLHRSAWFAEWSTYLAFSSMFQGLCLTFLYSSKTTHHCPTFPVVLQWPSDKKKLDSLISSLMFFLRTKGLTNMRKGN